MEINFAVAIPRPGLAPAQMSGSLRSADVSSSGGLCVVQSVESGIITATDCQHLSISVLKPVGGSANQDTYEAVQDRNLKGSSQGLFYASGDKTFTYNNWHGTVVFNGDNTQPSWTATSDLGESANGTITYQANAVAAASAPESSSAQFSLTGDTGSGHTSTKLPPINIRVTTR